MWKDTKNRPEQLRSSTRLVLLLFSIATIILAFIGTISGKEFLVAQGFVFGYFFGARRQDWTLPDDKKSDLSPKPE